MTAPKRKPAADADPGQFDRICKCGHSMGQHEKRRPYMCEARIGSNFRQVTICACKKFISAAVVRKQ